MRLVKEIYLYRKKQLILNLIDNIIKSNIDVVNYVASREGLGWLGEKIYIYI